MDIRKIKYKELILHYKLIKKKIEGTNSNQEDFYDNMEYFFAIHKEMIKRDSDIGWGSKKSYKYER